MTQYARPIQDITQGSWTDEGTVDNDGNLYSSVDEVTLDNEDSYIVDAGTNTLCEIKLGTISQPGNNTDHVLHILYRSIGSGGPEKLDIRLLQGTTEIVSLPNYSNRSSTYGDLNYSLSTVEADSITDYSDLRVELTGDSIGGSEEIRVSQIYLATADPSGVSVTPSPASVIASVVAPDVVEAAYITPTNANTIVSVVAPSVYEPEYATPAPAGVIVGSAVGSIYEPLVIDNPIATLVVSVVAPTVVESVYITPQSSSVIVGVVAPSVYEPEYVTPTASSVITDVVAPSVYEPEYATPVSASVIVDTVEPTVISDLLIYPSPAQVIADTVDPIVSVPVLIEPSPVSVIVATIDPTVYLGEESVRVFGPAWQSG